MSATIHTTDASTADYDQRNLMALYSGQYGARADHPVRPTGSRPVAERLRPSSRSATRLLPVGLLYVNCRRRDLVGDAVINGVVDKFFERPRIADCWSRRDFSISSQDIAITRPTPRGRPSQPGSRLPSPSKTEFLPLMGVL